MYGAVSENDRNAGVSVGFSMNSADRGGGDFAVQRIFHRNRPAGIARHSFPGVVVLVGTLSSENERWNPARRASRNFRIQYRCRFSCLPGECPPLRADRFLAVELFGRNSPIGDPWFARSRESGQRKKGGHCCPPLLLLPRPRPQEAMAFGRGCWPSSSVSRPLVRSSEVKRPPRWLSSSKVPFSIIRP